MTHAQPYERTKLRRDQRNGHYTRHLETTMGQIADLPVPRTRGGFQTQLFERYHRRRDELDSAIEEMFVKGVSTRKVGQVIETLTGSHPSASTVSRVFHTLEDEYEQWKQRQLAERYAYAFADGSYFTVIYNFEEVKRRSHTMAAAFRNEGSYLLLFYAVIRSLKFNKLTMPAVSQAQPDPALFHTT